MKNLKIISFFILLLVYSCNTDYKEFIAEGRLTKVEQSQICPGYTITINNANKYIINEDAQELMRFNRKLVSIVYSNSTCMGRPMIVNIKLKENQDLQEENQEYGRE